MISMMGAWCVLYDRGRESFDDGRLSVPPGRVQVHGTSHLRVIGLSEPRRVGPQQLYGTGAPAWSHTSTRPPAKK